MHKEVARPRHAASVLLVRPGPHGQHTVLMGRRSRRAKFAPDVFVFPGGRLDAADETVKVHAPLDERQAARLATAGGAGPRLARSLATAAVRETWEETGYLIGNTTAAEALVAADHSPLHFIARAITPTDSPIRFHARFFMADGAHLTHDPAGSGELSDLAWHPIEEALKLPIMDITEFILGHLTGVHGGDPRTALFTYRNGRPAIRWTGHP